MPRVFGVLLFALLCSCLGGSLVYVRIHRDAIEEHLTAPPQTATEQIHKLRAQFEAAGCAGTNLYEEAIPKQDFPNLICSMPGSEPGTIVIGAPADLDAPELGQDTRWATMALLPLLAESVGQVQHRFSLVFAVFSGQHGLRGASEYLKQLTKEQRQEIRAMVSLEDVGRTPLVYTLAQEDPLLARWLNLSSSTLRMRSIPMEVTAQSIETRLLNGQSRFDPDEYLVNAKAFQRAHVPAITLRSAPMSMISAMGRAGALPAGVSGKSFDLNSYEQAYNLLCVYLLNLDDNLGTQHRSPPVSEIAAKPAPPNPATEDSQKSGTLVSAVTSPAAATTDNPAASPTAPASVTTLPSQQESVDAIPDIPIFHAETELVLEDVSVTDARGAPVKGLQASDFILMENGKPQAIQVFEAHGPQTGSPAESANPLPAGTFTNRISAAPDAPLSIFLFDLLNTPPQDQAYARAQMLQFLRAMPRGKHVALFVLGTHLEIVQGFTDDAEGLAKMAEKVMRESSPFLTTQLQQQQDQGMAEEVERYAMPTVPSQAPSAVIAGLQAAETQTKNIFMAQRRATAANMEGIRADQRVTATLEALQIIARSVSAYPGRKNLVWLSGSFQIRLRPSSNGYLSVEERTAQALAPVSDLYNTTRYEDAIRAVTTLLANARIAVYPIDVRGLRVGGVELGVGSDQSRNLADFGNNNAYSTMLNDQSNLRADERSSMLDLADQTGGHIFINNDVRGSIARSLEEGSNYYTLAYTPEKNSADKGFRRVQVKMSRGSGTLAYRPGYYPTRLQDLVKQSGAHMLAVAMQPGLPQSTMLLVTARVLPPDVSSKAVRIDYSIDLSGVNFADTVDHRKRALLDCMAVALDGTGNIAGQVANTMDAALRPEEFSTFQRTGLPLHQELVLTPGTYVLRVGVLDRGSQRIGTVNVPLVVSSEAK